MKITVHGLGYIGLATASMFANEGHDVYGYDIDEGVRERLRQREPELTEQDLEQYVLDALDTGLTVTDEPVPAEYHLVCVPTPYDEDRGAAVLSYLHQAARTISELVRHGDTVILESTVPPGTTSGPFARSLSQSGMDPGQDIHLGYTPETVLPGNTVRELHENDRIVGGVDTVSTDKICGLYRSADVGEMHRAPDPTTAEFVKLAQNAARDVEIAYANTLALVADDYDVDVRTAIELANNHPRVDILDPGPGVGGHCLPFDPLFLSRWSDQTDLIECARTVNDRMPGHVVGRLEEALGGLENQTIAVMGIAYKGGVGDTRNSPGIAIIRQLEGEEQHRLFADGSGVRVDVRIHDPYVSESVYDTRPVEEAVNGADAIVFAAGHQEFAELEPSQISAFVAGDVIIDPIDIINENKWEDSGFDVYGL